MTLNAGAERETAMTDIVAAHRSHLPTAARDKRDGLNYVDATEALESLTFKRDLWRLLRRSALWCVVPFGALVAGLTLFPIPGAVIGNGFVTFESAAKRIQAPETAVVQAILVRDGDRVTAGQELVKLDTTAAETELAIITKSIDQLLARIARLTAESLDHDEIVFPQALLDRAGEKDVADMISAENQLFKLRLSTYAAQLGQMKEQGTQITEQVVGLTGQMEASQRQYELVSETANNLRTLVTSQLATGSRLNELEQQLAVLDGQRSQAQATMALAKARQAQLDSEIAELSNGRMSDAAAEMRESQISLMELSQQKVAAQSRLAHLAMRSPQDGVVTDLQIRTAGGVVSTTEVLMTIAPLDDELIAELKVSPRDAPHIYIDQPAELHFSAIGGANAPQYSGTVTFLAPDVTFDERSGTPYFTVRVSIDEPLNEGARNLGSASAGTPVEVYLLREAQPIFAFIARPLLDQAQRAFR